MSQARRNLNLLHLQGYPFCKVKQDRSYFESTLAVVKLAIQIYMEVIKVIPESGVISKSSKSFQSHTKDIQNYAKVIESNVQFFE